VIQLWKGFIVSYTTDGSPQFTVRCSDGLFQLTQMYPVRAISRQCWKTFNDGVNCPYSTHGSGGDPSSCDYYFDSANGCEAHHMTKYFGGHPAQPQGVVIKDNSTGLWGIGRSTVTATSIISDTIWGNALQEIWCNDDGDPGKAFWVNCMIAAGRDESDFYDALGIVGAGPICSYTGMLVYQNADGYRYIIAPMLDGQPPQGFQVDGNLNFIVVAVEEPSLLAAVQFHVGGVHIDDDLLRGCGVRFQKDTHQQLVQSRAPVGDFRVPAGLAVIQLQPVQRALAGQRLMHRRLPG